MMTLQEQEGIERELTKEFWAQQAREQGEKEITSMFSCKFPDEDKIKKYEQVILAGKNFALEINKIIPACGEKKLVIAKIQEAVMWANRAVSLNQSV